MESSADNSAADLAWHQQHIVNLEAQCAALEAEIQSLRARVDPTIAIVPPERSAGGAALLEVFWRAEHEEFTAENSYRSFIPQGGLISTRYLEIPPHAAQHLRLDPGNQPGLWLIAEIKLHHVDEQGSLIQPPAAAWNPQNNFAGMIALNQAVILPGAAPGEHCKVFNWNADPQLLLPLPPNQAHRPQVLSVSAAALDMAQVVMGQHGQMLLDQILLLQAKARGVPGR